MRLAITGCQKLAGPCPYSWGLKTVEFFSKRLGSNASHLTPTPLKVFPPSGVRLRSSWVCVLGKVRTTHWASVSFVV